jgi:catechol 2,3-dioxygenase-like lactoylglutathione lyase family enzyme
MRIQRFLALFFAVVLLLGLAAALSAASRGSVHVQAVDSIGMTVDNMDRAVDFYTRVLTFEKVSDTEVAGREYELLEGVFGARARIVRLRLGDETIELTEYLAPKGRPIPADIRPNDRAFQHAAIIVSDMAAAYKRLRQFNVEHASTGPQQLPDWNPNAGGISAFYFRDPDRHFLEILHFPGDKGLAKWHQPSVRYGATGPSPLFLGIDHTAIVVGDTDQTLRLYRDAFQMKVVGESENDDTEQEHLNNVFGARLRITAVRAAEGPGIELLEYLAPRDGRAAPDLHANDIAHWQTTLIADDPSRVNDLLRQRIFSLVSPNVISLPNHDLAIRTGILLRDLDGHGLRIGSR